VCATLKLLKGSFRHDAATWLEHVCRALMWPEASGDNAVVSYGQLAIDTGIGVRCSYHSASSVIWKQGQVRADKGQRSRRAS
jgi:hypothetical protein